MAKLTTDQIDEIAENIGMGMLCFYHILSGEIISLLPEAVEVDLDYTALYSEDEVNARNKLDKIEAHLNEYISFEKMSSRNAFDVMRAFALSIDHKTIKENLLHALEKRHPFQTFKNALHALPEEIIKEWYVFKDRKNRKWVEEQLELYEF